MATEVELSDDWLADRASLHDARVLSISLHQNTLSIWIDDEWPNVSSSHEDREDLGGWLNFDGAEILEGAIEDAEGRFVSELKLVDGRWLLYLSRPSFLSRRGVLAFRADSAIFTSCS